MEKKLHNQNGFTLIEVLVAIGILAAMVTMMSSTMGQVFFAKNNSQKRNELNHSIFVSLMKIHDDIHLSFYTANSFQGKNKTQLNGMIGTKEKIDFSSLNGNHFIKNKKDTDQRQIGYFLQEDPDSTEGLSFLMRRETDFLRDDLQEGGRSFPLLKNVSELVFSYYDTQKKAWQDEWDTGSVSVGGRLPSVIKVQIKMMFSQDEEQEPEEKFYELMIPIKMTEKINF